MDPTENLKIDPEFAELIPPLTDDELKQLEANILSEGEVLSPLIVWNGVIVDGHNRYRIIQKHPEIKYTVRHKEFQNRYEAITWICQTQLGRRNLTERQKKYLLFQQYEAAKASRGAADGFRGNQYSEGSLVKGQNDPLPKKESTRARIARENGITDSSMKRAISVSRGMVAAEEVLPGIRSEILSGSINPTDRAVEAIARASPEDRRELAEKLRQPRSSPKKHAASKSEERSPEEIVEIETENDNSDSPEDNSKLRENAAPTALSISERMASSPEREKREASVHAIIVELTDALESMMFRWDFQFSENSANLVHADCQQKIRELASRGIEYLKSHQGGNKDAGNET